MTQALGRVLGGHWPLTGAAAAPDKETEAGLKAEGLQSLPSPSTHGASAVPGSGEEEGRAAQATCPQRRGEQLEPGHPPCREGRGLGQSCPHAQEEGQL